MKRRYGMSPVSLSMRHTIKINDGGFGGALNFFEFVMTKKYIEEDKEYILLMLSGHLDTG